MTAAQLNTRPRSISKVQLIAIYALGKQRGLTTDDVRDAAGGSVRDLSRADASALIERLGGGELPNAPGDPPRRKRRRAEPDVYRMITDEHCEQIARLADTVFENEVDFLTWLRKNFKVATPREIGTAKRAGRVIHVLKGIIARRATKTDGQREERAGG